MYACKVNSCTHMIACKNQQMAVLQAVIGKRQVTLLLQKPGLESLHVNAPIHYQPDILQQATERFGLPGQQVS
jgi:hypothetical protein